MVRLSTKVVMAVSVVALAALTTPANLHAQAGGGGGGSAGGGAAAGSATTGTASPGMGGTATRGTNSLGTAQSSGGSVTTGMGRGVDLNGTNKSTDAVVEEENKLIDRKVQGICRGC
jgi:hypothetical protein